MQVHTAQGLPPIWSKALKRFKDSTNIDLEAIDDEGESSIPGLIAVKDAKSLSTTVHAKFSSNKILKHGPDRILESCKRAFGDVDCLLSHVTDAKQGNVRRIIIFRSFAALFLNANVNGSVNAVVHLWDQVPLMDSSLANNVPASDRAPFENVLISYVTLAGTVYNVIKKKHHGDTLSSDRDVKQVLSELHWGMNTLQWVGELFHDQIKRGWEHTLAEYASLVGLDVQSPNFPRKVTSAVELQAQLQALGFKESAAAVQLRANARELAELIMSRRIHGLEGGDIDTVVLGAFLTLIEASRGKTTAVALIADLTAGLTTILMRLPPIAQEAESSAAVILAQIKASTLRITGEGAKTLRSVSVPWMSSSLFARNDKLQSTIHELAWLVENASMTYAAQDTASTSRFADIWEKAIRRYTASTGVDISAWAAVQHIDALTSIETALENGRYTFQQEHKKAEEAAKVVGPVVKFIKTFVDPAADLAEPHLPGVKLAAVALEKLLDAADKLGSSYEPILSLFDALSDFLDRMRVHLTSRSDIEIMEIHEEVLAEMLVIFGVITGRMNKGFLGRLTTGDDDIKAATTRLQALLDKEDRMTGALVLSKLNDVKHAVEEGFASLSGNIARPQGAERTQEAIFPPRPVLFFGRKEEREYLVDAILQLKSIIALGTGGIGKTTVITDMLYDDQVMSQFTRRYFVSCEDVTTLDGLRTCVANVLSMPAEVRNEQLHTRILSELGRQPSVLFLDNFETLFDVAGVRRAVETELEAYTGVDGLALVVTMRGAEAPAIGRIQWAKLVLTPLSHEEGVTLFKKTARIADDTNDPFIDKLVDAVDSLPLAVTLLAHQVQPELGTTTRSLWGRWEKRRIDMVTRSDGARDRLLDLSTSIELSIYSPRMQHEPSAKSVMALLSQLPGGLPFGTNTSEQMQSALEDSVDLSLSLQTLCRVGLAYADTNGAHPRYRMLAPIREYCRGHSELQLSRSLWESLTDFYIQFVEENGDYVNAACLAVVPPELPNIRQVLASRNWETGATSSAIRASIDYTSWTEFLGAPSIDILQLCIAYVHDNELLGDCHYTMANVYSSLDRNDDAETALNQALEYHKASGSQKGEANDLQNLAWIYQYRGDLRRAMDHLEEALSLHRAIEDRKGEARALGSLGDLFYREDDLEEAEKSLIDALSLYRAINHCLGEANVLQSLGDVYCRKNYFYKAERTYKKAASLHHSLQDRTGEATDHQSLAIMYFQKGNLDKAEASSCTALDLFATIHNRFGQANSLQGLGKVYLYREDLSKAEESLKNALSLHQAVQARTGLAVDLALLGEIYMKSDRNAEAEKVLHDAVDLYRTIHMPLGEGNALQILGKVYTKMARFDEAEAILTRALELHQAIEWAKGSIGNDEWALEELLQAREASARDREVSTPTGHPLL